MYNPALAAASSSSFSLFSFFRRIDSSAAILNRGGIHLNNNLQHVILRQALQ